MSRKNSREEKKKRRLLKALRDTPDAYVDLFAYVRQRTNCTVGMAEKVILSGALAVDGKPVGYGFHKAGPDRTVKVLERFVPAELAAKIEVLTPKILEEANANES